MALRGRLTILPPLVFLEDGSVGRGASLCLCGRCGFVPERQGRAVPHGRLSGGSTDLRGTRLGEGELLSKAAGLRGLSPNHPLFQFPDSWE